jgi:threonine/homoserine/homoserine lactone efflux protein
MSHFGAFLVLSAIVIVVPGPDTAVALKNGLRSRRGGIATGCGVVSGLFVWTVAASAGVAAVVAASEPVFLALRLVGGAYLAFLGLQALIAAARREPPGGVAPGRPAASVLNAYRQGLVSDLGNPKIAVFFTSFLPQFTRSGSPAFWGMLALGVIFCAMTLTWLTGYAFAAARAGELLRRPRVRRAVDAVSGTVLVGFGVRLALERR